MSSNEFRITFATPAIISFPPSSCITTKWLKSRGKNEEIHPCPFRKFLEIIEINLQSSEWKRGNQNLSDRSLLIKISFKIIFTTTTSQSSRRSHASSWNGHDSMESSRKRRRRKRRPSIPGFIRLSVGWPRGVCSRIIWIRDVCRGNKCATASRSMD